MRRLRMKTVCRACHSQNWINGHFKRLSQTIEETNKRTLAATRIILTAWEKGVEEGLPQISPFLMKRLKGCGLNSGFSLRILLGLALR